MRLKVKVHRQGTGHEQKYYKSSKSWSLTR